MYHCSLRKGLLNYKSLQMLAHVLTEYPIVYFHPIKQSFHRKPFFFAFLLIHSRCDSNKGIQEIDLVGRIGAPMGYFDSILGNNEFLPLLSFFKIVSKGIL